MSILTVEHLSHGFGDRAIFDDVSFRLLKGEHIGLIGANGEGKSTFINIITGKLMPDSGDITWAKHVRVGKGGMTRTQTVGKQAVECGYWHLWHYNPQLEEQGKNPFVLDSKEPDWAKFRDFLLKEVRYTSLKAVSPEDAEALFQAAEQNARWRYEGYVRRSKIEY